MYGTDFSTKIGGSKSRPKAKDGGSSIGTPRFALAGGRNIHE